MDKLEMLKMFASANKDAAGSSKLAEAAGPAVEAEEEAAEGCSCDCAACKNCLNKE